MKTIGCVLCLYTIWASLDFVNLFLIYDKFLMVERKTLKKSGGIWIGLMLLISYMHGLQCADIMYNKILFWIVYFSYYLKMIPVLWSLFLGRKKDVLLVLFYQLMVATLAQGIYLFADNPFSNMLYDLFVNDLCEVVATLVITVLLLFLLLIRRNNIIKVYFGDLSVSQYLVFCMVLFASNLLEVDVIMEYPDNIFLKVLSAENVIVVCIFMFQMIIVRESGTRREKVIEVLEEHMKKVTDYYYAMIELENQTRKFRHDIKNLLFALHSMIEQGENEKTLEYLEEMNDLCQRTTKKYDTGNFIADALLSAKSSVALNSNIEICFDGFIPSDGVETVDMVILLSNIVDNAVEACEKISGQKKIIIESVLQKHMWILLVKNPVETDVMIKKNKIETTKKNKELHGYGIQNMQRVVKKQNGNLKFSCKDGIFEVRVMLQLKKNR